MNDELDDALRRLPKEIPPERDLWPDIAERIAAPAARPAGAMGIRGARALALAATLAALAIALGSILLQQPGVRGVARARATPSPVPLVLPATPAPSASPGTRSDVDALAASFEPLRERILSRVASDPGAKELLERESASFAVSIKSLESLARRNPDDVDVLLALARVRREEVRLLARLAADA